MRRILLVFLFCSIALIRGYSQGSTTASLIGKISDSKGEALPGATVLAVHVPTSSQYGAVTDENGNFRIANMRVGGPYTVTVSFVGFSDFKKEDITLSLGQSFVINTALSEDAQTLNELVIESSAVDIFNSERTGAKTSISKDQIEGLPNLSRDINDFARLTPQANFSGGGISIAGINNRYNAIFIDGAVSNDVFGLAANGQNGGQVAGLSLMSMDALEQISVTVAPYDVTLGGFAGGGISAVTRSGSNTVEGSVYYLVRNESLAGKTPSFISDKNRKRLPDFAAKTLGFRIGGPIIKDKLFFFVNAEIKRDETPQPFNFATSYNGAASQADINNLLTTLDGLGYDPGSYQDTKSELEAERFLVKLDYNINKTHKLSIRHSYNKGESLSPATSNTNRIRFMNGGVAFPSTTNSTTLELQSNFSNKSNKLIIGVNKVVDDRDPMGSPFPYVIISTGDIQFGSEEFSTANFLEQKVITFTDNFTLYKGNHTFTFGTHNEYYKMNNVFIGQNFGSYRYATIADFIDDVDNGTATGAATQYDRSYSLVDNTTGDNTGAAAKFKAMQLGFYAQDEWQATPKLKLTGGVRVDIPMFLDDPKTDDHFNDVTIPLIEAEGYDLKGARSGSAPKTQMLLAPRIGFNFDVTGDQKTQIRGGLGIFTSRVPFVWPGAMYNNNGLTIGATRQNANISFNSDPFDQPTVGDFGGSDAIPQGQINVFAKDFKFPQIFRTSIGVDQKIPFWGLIGSLEFMYTKTLNNVFYENLNLKKPIAQFDGTPDNRNRYATGGAGRVDNTYQTYIILGSNTNEGFAYNFTASLTKPFEKGFTGMLAYNFGRAEAIFEGTSSQNSSQWRGVYAINGRNNASLGRSDFDAAHRIIASLSYRKEYLKNLSTTIGLFYEGQSGTPFSYTYSAGVTGEDSRERTLIFVPEVQTDIVLLDITNGPTAAEQWEALDAFIENDDYLKTRRGKYAEKNMGRTPFSNIIDLKVTQEVFIMSGNRRHSLQFSLDIFNFTNFLNKDWGKRYNVPNGDGTSVQLLNFSNFSGNTPRFTYNSMAKNKEDLLTKDDAGFISSRWQMQFGLRYSF